GQLAADAPERGQRPADHGQDLLARHVVALGGTDGDLDAVILLAPRAHVAGDDPARGPVETGLRIDHDEALAIARQLPGRVHVGPALGQLEAQAHTRVRIGRHAHARRREEVVATHDGPLRGDAGIVAAVTPALVDAVAPAQGAALL